MLQFISWSPERRLYSKVLDVTVAQQLGTAYSQQTVAQSTKKANDEHDRFNDHQVSDFA